MVSFTKEELQDWIRTTRKLVEYYEKHDPEKELKTVFLLKTLANRLELELLDPVGHIM